MSSLDHELNLGHFRGRPFSEVNLWVLTQLLNIPATMKGIENPVLKTRLKSET